MSAETKTAPVSVALRFSGCHDTNCGEGWSIDSAGIEFLSICAAELKHLQDTVSTHQLHYCIGTNESGEDEFAPVTVELTEPIASKWSTHNIHGGMVVSRKSHSSDGVLEMQKREYVKYRWDPQDTWIALSMNSRYEGLIGSQRGCLTISGFELMLTTASEAAILKQLDVQGRLFCHVGHSEDRKYYANVHVKQLQTAADTELSSSDICGDLHFLVEGSSQGNQVVYFRDNDRRMVSWDAFDHISELPRERCAKEECTTWVKSSGEMCPAHIV